MGGQVKVTTTSPLNNLSNTKTLVQTLVMAISQTLVSQNTIQITMTIKKMDTIFKVSHTVFKVKTLVSIAMKIKVTIHGVKVIRIFKVSSSFIKAKVNRLIFTTGKVINIKVISLVQLIMVSMETIRVRVSMEFRGLSKDFIQWVWGTTACIPIECSVWVPLTMGEIQ